MLICQVQHAVLYGEDRYGHFLLDAVSISVSLHKYDEIVFECEQDMNK